MLNVAERVDEASRPEELLMGPSRKGMESSANAAGSPCQQRPAREGDWVVLSGGKTVIANVIVSKK